MKYIEEAIILFDELKSSIEKLKSNLDDNFSNSINLILNSSGRLIFMGIGKSGHIGKKAAASFASTGTNSQFIDPIHAQHGDFGMISNQDIVILLSHSGNTKEMIDILPTLNNIGVKTIAITSNPSSKLASFSNYHINTLVKKEICPHNLAPTTSTTITLTILDIIMVILMKEKKFRKEEFALFHPAGSLGKKLLLKIHNILEYNTDHLTLSSSFSEVVSMISSIKKGAVTVIEQGDIIGIITDGDIRRAMEKFKSEVFSVTIEEIMTKNPKCVQETDLAVDVLTTMEAYNITSIPVLKGEEYVGIINIHDLLKEGLK